MFVIAFSNICILYTFLHYIFDRYYFEKYIYMIDLFNENISEEAYSFKKYKQ